jgi:hypothetical protein
MNNTIKKFGYTIGDDFALSGTSYIGFYNVVNSVGYVSKFNQTTVLQNIPRIQNGVIRSNKFFNRLPTQNFSLTYSLSDILFQPNEFINSNSFDNKLAKLYINYLDTYVSCFIASSDLPYNFAGVARYDGVTGIEWDVSSTGISIPPLSSYNTQIRRESKIVYATNEYNSNNTLILANSASLMVFSVYNGLEDIPPSQTFNVVMSSFYIETSTQDYGSLEFANITDISKSNNDLFVCDKGNKTVYYYDISNVLKGDRALGYKFNLIDTLSDTQGTIVSPELISSSENTVFIYDSSSGTIQYYDRNFNIYNSYKNLQLFSDSPPVSLTYYKLYNSLFVLTRDFKIVVLDENANATIINLSTKGNLPGELAKKIIFSNIDSDVVYLLTNKNLYKKFISNIIENLGYYSFTQNITGTNSLLDGTYLYDIDILQSDQNIDDILVYGFDQFINYKELTVYNSIIK